MGGGRTAHAFTRLPVRAAASVRRSLTRTADRFDAATPPDRERALDGLRALGVCGIVLGHWFVTALVLWADGGLRISSPLRDLPGLAPLSWVLQTLALFFLVGGYVSALALDRARERGEPERSWLLSRTRRLGRPVVLVAAAWGAAAALLPVAGVPEATVRSLVLLVLQPLWFIAVYTAATLLTPVAVAVERRIGLGAAAALVLPVAAVDLLLYGPWTTPVPAWAGLASVLPAWLFAYLLGISWARGRLARGRAWALLAGGAAALAVLVAVLGYPASAVGLPGADRSNLNPPSLFVPALAAVQISAAVLLRGPLERLLRRPAAWAPVAAVNLAALTVFCWHLTAASLPALAAAAAGPPVPGLTSAPDGAGWVAARLAWLPVFALLLAACSIALRRFEGPWRGIAASLPFRAVVGAGAAAFALAAVHLA
ncbi:acyltransferase family protein [Nocardiopsis baichengensis]|uniref:acyltransferase family protein n=1 Tax=Nocardiopsis baichengensis TaxID=280240 RepID=UPI000349935A|nr:acyltransferase family protein [Nocardiopsis baichengensis]